MGEGGQIWLKCITGDLIMMIRDKNNIFERVENFHADLAWNYPVAHPVHPFNSGTGHSTHYKSRWTWQMVASTNTETKAKITDRQSTITMHYGGTWTLRMVSWNSL